MSPHISCNLMPYVWPAIQLTIDHHSCSEHYICSCPFRDNVVMASVDSAFAQQSGYVSYSKSTTVKLKMQRTVPHINMVPEWVHPKHLERVPKCFKCSNIFNSKRKKQGNRVHSNANVTFGYFRPLD